MNSRTQPISFQVLPAVAAIGLRGMYFGIRGMKNDLPSGVLDAYVTEAVDEAKAWMAAHSVETDPVLVGFRDLHEAVRCNNRRNVASPENLLKLVAKSGNLPRINPIVDIYNCISLRTRLALGAHDVRAIVGDVRLGMTNGSERFVPLGGTEAKPVDPGEYAYMDGANEVLCRLEVRQVEKTKVTVDTSECFYIVQGNGRMPPEYVRAAGRTLIEDTKRFCGGEEYLLHDPG